MTILDLPPLDGFTPQTTPPPGAVGSGQSARLGAAAGSGLLQFQIRRLISDILADPDLDPDMYVSLAGHLAQNPDHPELVLLAHLRDVHDPGDLPPVRMRLPKRTS